MSNRLAVLERIRAWSLGAGTIPKRERVFIATVGLLAAAVFLLNRNPVTEQGIYIDRHVPYSAYLFGGASLDTVTYPIWGYPILIGALGDTGLIALQFILALSSFGLLYRHLFRALVPTWQRLVVLATLSVPWFALASLNSASAVAVPLLWIAAALLWEALPKEKPPKRALFAGVVFGIALNLRPEFLPLAVVPAIGGALYYFTVRARGRQPEFRQIVKPVVFSTTAIALLLPWAIFSRHSTGELRFTSSNAGAVGVISLGQLPNNPWGIRHSDSEAGRILAEAGHPQFDPFSPEGDRILRSRFLAAISEHPGAYARKVIYNSRNAFIGSFYVGDWETWVPGIDPLRVDVVREKLKNALGLNPNVSDISMYKESGLWDEPVGPAIVFTNAAAVTYLIASGFMVIVGVIGAIWLAINRRLDRRTSVAAVLLIYVLILSALLQYQPRHINTAWPALMAFSLILWSQKDALRSTLYLPRPSAKRDTSPDHPPRQT